MNFVGVDWYPPCGDWRDGSDQTIAGYARADSDYLLNQLAGGEVTGISS